MNPPKLDLNYEYFRVLSKELPDSTKKMISTVNKAAKAVEDVVAAYMKLEAAMEELVTCAETTSSTDTTKSLQGAPPPPTSRDLIDPQLVNYGGQLKSILLEFRTLLDTHVRPAAVKLLQSAKNECEASMRTLDEDREKVEDLRQTMKKSFDEFSSAYDSVVEKEREYSKKGKPVAQSKQYPGLVSKLEETRRQYDAFADKYRAESVHLFFERDALLAVTLQSILEHSADFFDAFHVATRRPFLRSAVNTHLS